MRARAVKAPLPAATPLPFVAVAAVVTTVVVLCVPARAAAGAASPSRPPSLGTVVVPAIGFGYSVTSQGPLDASRFPAGSPSAKAAADALGSLGSTIDSYQRSWQDGPGANQVQDLVVRFGDDGAARAFVVAARHAIARGEIVSAVPLPSIPGAQRATYFASTSQTGVGQTITMRSGAYAAVLSFFSATTGNPALITQASAAQVADAQYLAMARAAAVPGSPGGGLHARDAGGPVLGVVALAAGGAALVVLAAAVTTVLVLRRRRRRGAD